MAASITFYQTFRKWLGDGTFDLDANTFKVTLHTSTYSPNAATNTVYADLTNELSTANGYTNGGATLRQGEAAGALQLEGGLIPRRRAAPSGPY